MKKLTAIITLLLMTVQMSFAQVAGHDYAKVVCDDCDVNISDEEFYQIARTVVFPVNKYTIPENSDFYHEIVNEIVPEMNQRGYRLEHIIMRGAASPEGPTQWNVFLAKKRQEALFKIIDDHMDIPSCTDCITGSEVPEDYDLLVKMMGESNDKDYDLVKSIVDDNSHDAAALKSKLQKANGGKLWRRLLKEYFPQLRAARVVLVFKQWHEKENLSRVYADTPEMTLPPLDLGLGNWVLSDSLHFDLNVIGTLSSLGEQYKPADQPKEITEEKPVEIKTTADILPRRELLSVKTNLLFDFAYMPSGYDRFCPIPNVAVEYYPLHGHFTYGASFDCPWWQDYDAHKYFQIRNYQLETRYYFKSGDVRERGYGNGAAFRGLYLQAYAHAGLYSIMFSEHRGWEGEGFGGGVGVGYVLPLTKTGHWRLEFGAQVGYFWTKYDPYQYECPVDPTEGDNLYYYKWTLDAKLFKRRQHRFTWTGPTRVGITLTYDLLYRKRVQKGTGFRNWEYNIEPIVKNE